METSNTSAPGRGEVVGHLHLGERASEIELGNARDFRRSEFLHCRDGLRRRRPHAGKVAEHPFHRAVVRLNGALIRLVVLHERRARRPLVGQQSAEQPAAPFPVGSARRLTQATEGTEVQRLRALDGIQRGRIDDVGIGRFEQRVFRAAGSESSHERENDHRHGGDRAAKPAAHRECIRHEI
jgi:hypothetical protein